MIRLTTLLLLFVITFHSRGQDSLMCSKFQHLHHSATKKQSANRLADPRLNDYDVSFYFLDIRADNLSTDLDGQVTIVAHSQAESLNEFVLELHNDLTVNDVTVNGASQPFIHSDGLIIITLSAPVALNEKVEVTVDYEGTPPSDDGFFAGISQDLGPFDIPVTWTLSEPFNASDWFPVKQVLTDKADSANIYITVPDHLMAGAPGILRDKNPISPGQTRYEWETRYPIAYYLISMAIAPYREIRQDVSLPGMQNTLPVINYIYDNDQVENTASASLATIPDMLVLFSEMFGTYPFSREKYGHAMAPMGGGMEHQTMSTMAGFTFTLNAHELMHQWFGDDVTCASFRDIWINEGFARYGEYLAIENLISKNDADDWMTNNYNSVLSQPGGSVYIPESGADDPYRIFDFRLTYNKGGALLHMLRHLFNDDVAFFTGMKEFRENYSGSEATGEDFKVFMQSYTPHSLDPFFQQWYYGEGYPIYSLDWTYENGTLEFILEQTTSVPEVTSFFSIPVPVLVKTPAGSVTLRLSPETTVQTFTFDSFDEVLSVELDPENVLLNKASSMVTSVPRHLDKGFRYFPNPANGSVFIEISSGLTYEATLTDMQGKVLISRILTPEGRHRINTEDVPSGLYLLQLKNDRGAWTERIALTH